MSLKLIPPGKRKNNRYYLLRGRVRGRVIELSAKKDLDPDAAKRWRAETEAGLFGPPTVVGVVFTFADAIDEYLAATRPALETHDALEWLRRDPLAMMALRDVRPMHLIAAAHRLYPDTKNATKNRWGITPAAAVMSFANKNGLCAWGHAQHLPEDKRTYRRVFGAENQGKLVAAAKVHNPDLWRLLIGLAYQGWRIGEYLGLDWEHVDLPRSAAMLRVGKAKTWKLIRLSPEFYSALASVPEAERVGRVFPFKDRHAVYRALRPLNKALGLHFTPHMARHDFATDLNAAGATLNDIRDASSWTSTEAIRDHYIEADERQVRAVLAKLPKRGVA